MLPTTKAITEVKFRIPRPILDAVFMDRNTAWGVEPTSIDEHIMAEVVRPRVMVDCNLLGGTEALIDLAGIPYVRSNDYTSVYRIPKTKTQGRSITSVLSINFSDPTKINGYGVSAQQQNTAMMQTAMAVLNAAAPAPITSTARLQLIGENTVMVRDVITLPANIFLRCILANDENMAHLPLRSYRHFADLVTHAVKAYIYNEYVVRMDQGELYMGQSLGRFKDIIDGYADSEQNYQDFLKLKWEKVAMMADTESYTRFLRSMMGSNH